MPIICFSQARKKEPKDTVNISQFLNKISTELTTDKVVVAKYNKNKQLKTLTLYYDPKANVSIAGSDLSKRNR